MWVMTTKGFYSVVETKDGKAMVRGRDKADLEALVEALKSSAPVLETKHADYPFRVILPKSEWARFLSNEANGLNYSNFKSEVTKKQGNLRHDVYMRVWSALHGIEEKRQRWASWTYTKPQVPGQTSLMPEPTYEYDPIQDDSPQLLEDALLDKCECDHRMVDHGDEAWLDHFDTRPHDMDDCAESCPTDECQVDGCQCEKFREPAVAGR